MDRTRRTRGSCFQRRRSRHPDRADATDTRRSATRDTGFHHCGRNALEFEIRQDLGPANRLGGTLQQAIAEGIDRSIEFAGGHAMIHQADLLGLFRSQQLAGQQVFLGATEADALSPDHRTAIASHQAQRHVRIADLRGVDSEDHVKEQRQRGAETDRMTVPGGRPAACRDRALRTRCAWRRALRDRRDVDSPHCAKCDRDRRPPKMHDPRR